MEQTSTPNLAAISLTISRRESAGLLELLMILPTSSMIDISLCSNARPAMLQTSPNGSQNPSILYSASYHELLYLTITFESEAEALAGPRLRSFMRTSQAGLYRKHYS